MESKNDGEKIPWKELAEGIKGKLYIIAGDYRLLYANRLARDRFPGRFKNSKVIYCYEALENRLAPCSAPLINCPLQEVLAGGKKKVIYHTRPGAPGGASLQKTIKATFFPLKDSNGMVQCAFELRQDVTQEKKLEDLMIKYYNHLRALEQVAVAVGEGQELKQILNLCLDTALELVNDGIGGILLLDDQNRLSYRVYRGLSSWYAENMRMALGEGVAGKVAKTGQPVLLEDISISAEAVRHDLLTAEGLKGFLSVPLKIQDKVVGVINIASRTKGKYSEDDLNLLGIINHQLETALEQGRLYDSLNRAQERYRRLLQFALQAQEEERQRIARELHDETSQVLTSLSLSLQALIDMARIQGIGDSAFNERLKKAHAYSVNAGIEVTKLMKKLRPTLLDELGMPAAIHRYAKDILGPKGIKLEVTFNGMEHRFPPEVEITLFRIAQGAIGNILKHAEAGHVSISLDCDQKHCRLKVDDDGKGFDIEQLNQIDPCGRGAGLFTMKERANLVGGGCQIESLPGRGTRVTAFIPIIEVDHGEED